MKKKLLVTSIIIFMAVAGLIAPSKFTNNMVLKVYAAEQIKTGEVKGNGVNVRSGPGTSYEKIGTISGGKIITILESDGAWYKIEYNGETGYISADYVTLSEASADDVSADDNTDADNATDTEDEDTEKSGLISGIFDSNLKTIGIIIIIAIILLVIIFATIASIKRIDYDDEYEDYDDVDDYQDEDYDDDSYEDYDEDYEEYYEKEEEYIKPAPKIAKEPERYMSNNPDDYRIDIDPKFFETSTLPIIEDEDAPVPIGKSGGDNISSDNDGNSSSKDADIAEAMRKMEELQKEIERIKNRK